MAVPVYKFTSEQYVKILQLVNSSCRILDKLVPYNNIYTLDNVVTFDVVDNDNVDAILIQSAKLQSFVERLTHLIEFNYGKFDRKSAASGK